jgi:hypothetical protein
MLNIEIRDITSDSASSISAALLGHLAKGTAVRKAYRSLLRPAGAYDKPATVDEAAAHDADAEQWLKDLLEGRLTLDVCLPFWLFDDWADAHLELEDLKEVQMHRSFLDVLSALSLPPQGFR